MWRFIFSALCCFVCFTVLAQEPKLPDSLMETRPKFAPRFIQVNYNALRFVENLLNKPQNSQEVQVEMGIHKFQLVADIGRAETNRGNDYVYRNDGTYWRVGFDINMSKAWEEQMIGLGLRYARASYQDAAIFTRPLGDGSEQAFELANTDLEARWAELVFKMRVPVWKGLITGYTMRYQFFQVTQGLEGSQLKPFDIPGYGKTNRPNSFGFDYYIGWRIDL